MIDSSAVMIATETQGFPGTELIGRFNGEFSLSHYRDLVTGAQSVYLIDLHTSSAWLLVLGEVARTIGMGATMYVLTQPPKGITSVAIVSEIHALFPGQFRRLRAEVIPDPNVVGLTRIAPPEAWDHEPHSGWSVCLAEAVWDDSPLGRAWHQCVAQLNAVFSGSPLEILLPAHERAPSGEHVRHIAVDGADGVVSPAARRRNALWRAATHSDCLFLSTPAVLPHDFVRELAPWRAALSVPRLVTPSGERTADWMVSSTGMATPATALLDYRANYAAATGSGDALMVRRALLEKHAFNEDLDEREPLDREFVMRLRRAGVSLRIAPVTFTVDRRPVTFPLLPFDERLTIDVSAPGTTSQSLNVQIARPSLTAQ